MLACRRSYLLSGQKYLNKYTVLRYSWVLTLCRIDLMIKTVKDKEKNNHADLYIQIDILVLILNVGANIFWRDFLYGFL